MSYFKGGLIAREPLLRARRDGDRSISDVYGSGVMGINQGDLPLDGVMAEVHVIEDKRLVVAGPKTSEVVNVRDPTGRLSRLLLDPTGFPNSGRSDQDEYAAFRTGSSSHPVQEGSGWWGKQDGFICDRVDIGAVGEFPDLFGVANLVATGEDEELKL